MKRKRYFDRADKDEVYRFILSFSDGEELLKNVNEALNIDYVASKVVIFRKKQRGGQKTSHAHETEKMGQT